VGYCLAIDVFVKIPLVLRILVSVVNKEGANFSKVHANLATSAIN
jgi:hypothetical protein